jgi:hypothetical protein
LDFGLALIDGDHSHEGVKRDVEAFLPVRPTRTQWLILHDTFNPTVRNGIRAVNWNVPWVHKVEIDFVSGNLMSNPHVRKQMWGGSGLPNFGPQTGKALFKLKKLIACYMKRAIDQAVTSLHGSLNE